ncbi:methyl-accepting chemotaxis protein [Stigmatella hybrida]|uniref:methyl-accepting chemotaxis protein n=1 Tax=Stigmatella hybrida TaxID=394097 RepID=UPI001CDB0B53|nr:methyl-accepting chemotaxis protein [Stigmatella hybrida]
MDTSDAKFVGSLSRRGLGIFMSRVLPAAPIAAYLNGMTVGVAGEDGLLAVAAVLPCIILGLGIAYPYLVLRFLMRSALLPRQDDRPGERLARILRLPWRGAFYSSVFAWTMGGFFFALPVCLYFDKPLNRVVIGTIVGVCCGVVLMFPIGLGLEKLLFPVALQERKAHPNALVVGGGVFWPRQSWFLPFTFVASLLATVMLGSSVVAVKLMNFRDALRAEIALDGGGQSAAKLQALGSTLFTELVFALPWVCGLVLILPGITAWLLARRQAEGAAAVRVAIEGLAAGRITAPEWVSTDEIGELSAQLNNLLSRLRQIPETLHSSATRLVAAGKDLTDANSEQEQSLNQQAAAIQETQVTSQEIKQTSQMTAERAEAMLRVAKRAEELGHEGEAAIEQSMVGLSAFQQFVEAMQEKLNRLAESASQIGDITEAVKDMADQSNLLAVNAAIEAARAGEEGKGFAVLAREVRALADQSVKSTTRIRNILNEVIEAIEGAASMAAQGSRDIADGLDQMRASSNSLRELSRLSQENSAAMRQIVAAVSQQNAGISQIFGAIADLSQIMDSTLKRLESTQQATGTLHAVSTEVSEMARRFTVN